MTDYVNAIAPGPEIEPGLRCPRCSSAWSETMKTLRLAGSVRRYRRCRHCSRRFTTLEVPQRLVAAALALQTAQ